MTLLIEMTGKKCGRLTVIKRSRTRKGGRVKWDCICECGNKASVGANALRNGNTKSCGCFNKERISATHTTHGLTNHRLFSIWRGIKDRCYNKNVNHYKWYGAKGVTIFRAWKNNFKVFYDWAMENGYEAHLAIDRRDNNKNYTPSNCQWITQAENNKKTRGNKHVNNKSGYCGVRPSPNGEKWTATIATDNGRKWLGTFKTKKAAIAAISNYD